MQLTCLDSTHNRIDLGVDVKNPRIGHSGPEYPPPPQLELLMVDLETLVQNILPHPRLELLVVDLEALVQCNSMPFGAAWAYYGKVLALVSAA